MQYRKIGNSDIDASVVAFGAWAIGGWMWGGSQDDDAVKAIHAGLEHGINFIDTAAIYGYGLSERVVGRAIRGRRDKVILATKCGLVWDKRKGTFYFHGDDQTVRAEPSKYEVYKYLDPESIYQEVEQSLTRLGTDYIDLYQTHWQESTTPIEETMAALLKLKEQGKIRAIGVSNANIDQLRAYGPIDSDQERFSMLDRKVENNGQLRYCLEHNIAMLAYSPLEQGLLTGKVPPDRRFAPDDQRTAKPLFSVENRKRILAMLDEFRPIATDQNATVTQIVIAWTFSQPGLTHLLCGARTEQQAIENAAAGDITLTQEQLIMIEAIVRKYFDVE